MKVVGARPKKIKMSEELTFPGPNYVYHVTEPKTVYVAFATFSDGTTVRSKAWSVPKPWAWRTDEAAARHRSNTALAKKEPDTVEIIRIADAQIKEALLVPVYAPDMERPKRRKISRRNVS